MIDTGISSLEFANIMPSDVLSFGCLMATKDILQGHMSNYLTYVPYLF